MTADVFSRRGAARLMMVESGGDKLSTENTVALNSRLEKSMCTWNNPGVYDRFQLRLHLVGMSHAQRVIAIGSPHGDDQVAWRLVERLRMREGINASVVALADPSQVHDYIDGCERLIIVDACASGDSPGMVTRMEWPNARIDRRHSHSTHGFGLADALQLADQLDRLPPQVVVFGIELSQCQPLGSLSGIVESALCELEEKILLEIH